MAHHVLIIEDEPAWQERHQRTFSELDFEPATVITGKLKDIVRTIDQADPPFDIIVVDMNFSGSQDSEDRLMGVSILEHVLERGRGEKCLVISGEHLTMSQAEEFATFREAGVLIGTFHKGDDSLKRSIIQRVESVLEARDASPNDDTQPTKPTNRVFISYRRADNPAITGRLYDHLSNAIGTGNIFKDVDNIAPGGDFPVVLDEQLRLTTVMLMVIGQNWLQDENGTKRLNNPTDWVRIEIETALQRNMLLIPVLVDNAQLPKPEDLPVTVRGLVYKQTLPLRHDPDFRDDVQKLIKAIESYTPA
jgi:hypothetical protein